MTETTQDQGDDFPIDIEDLIGLAHAAPDEVDPMELMLRAAWEVMSPEQRVALTQHVTVVELAELVEASPADGA